MSQLTVNLTKLQEGASRTLWRADFPAKPGKTEGSTYRVITYPGSDLVSLETWAKGRPVSPNTATRLTATIRAALVAHGALKGPHAISPQSIRLEKLEGMGELVSWKATLPDGQEYRATERSGSDVITVETFTKQAVTNDAIVAPIAAALLGRRRALKAAEALTHPERLMREHRRKNFGFTSEAVRDGMELFEGERVYRFTYNGRQEASVLSLAPHEARRFYDQLAKDFGFDKEAPQS